MSDELARELRAIKDALHTLQQRVVAMEAQLLTPPPPVSAAPPIEHPPAITPVVSPRIVPASPRSPAAPQRPCPTHPTFEVQWQCNVCHAPVCKECRGVAFQGRIYCCSHCAAKASAVPGRVPQAAAPHETLETRIGRDWLNRIGVISLVLGVAFFILYTFQYLGPAAKIAIGFVVGAALTGGGMWLERRESLRRYALGLIGGGWALTYFTAYAMYHIPSVRILSSAVLDLLLLMAIAAGAVRHSLQYRSEVITALALLLGFITTGVSDVTYFTLASSALLVIALTLLVLRLRWYGLYLYGVVVSYLTYFFWIEGQIQLSTVVARGVGSAGEALFWLQAGFVGLYWVAYNSVLFAVKVVEEERPRRRLLAATIVNGLGFVCAILMGMERIYPATRYLFLLGVGALYVASAPLARRRHLATLAELHLLFGLSLMTFSLPLKWTGRWLSFLWTAEVPVLAWVGLRTGRWPYRMVAGVLALQVFGRLVALDLWSNELIVVGSIWMPWRLLMGAVAVAAFGATAAAYRRLSPVDDERVLSAFHGYVFAGAYLLWQVLLAEIGSRWEVDASALEAVTLVLLGLAWRDRTLRLVGAGATGISALYVIALVLLDDHHWLAWHWDPAATVTALVFGLSGCYKQLPPTPRFELEGQFHAGFIGLGTLLLTALLWQDTPTRWLSVAWGVEGLVLVAWGFVQQDKPLRLAGLAVFALLVLKILFVDLAEAETIYRILSFIGAGCVLLAASFGYARFATKRDASQDVRDHAP